MGIGKHVSADRVQFVKEIQCKCCPNMCKGPVYVDAGYAPKFMLCLECARRLAEKLAEVTKGE